MNDENPAARLVTELMLVSVLVAGEGAADLAAALGEAGAAAEILDQPDAPGGFDLAILLAPPGSAGSVEMAGLVASVSRASERVLFVPLPSGGEAAAKGPELPELTQWFEVFAELGYQPVVDFDAGFMSAGAFLVDREAVAAESDLSAFAERLQHGPSPVVETLRVAALEAERVNSAERGTLQASLAERDTRLAMLQAELASLRDREAAIKADAAAHLAAADGLRAQNEGWDALRLWVRNAVMEPGRDTEAALAHDLPWINARRGEGSPKIVLGRGPARARSRLARLLLRPLPAVRDPVLADTALVRASALFDAAWYIASTPDLAAPGAPDPVFHYVLVGSLLGADPGPWFDSAAYLRANPVIAGSGICPLVHAIRSGEADRLLAALGE